MYAVHLKLTNVTRNVRSNLDRICMHATFKCQKSFLICTMFFETILEYIMKAFKKLYDFIERV